MACNEAGVNPLKMRHELEQAFKRATKPAAKKNKKSIPMMCIDELREGGYLQEVNRRFFHPLGMALSTMYDTNLDGELVKGSGRLDGVWDYRDDPEGMSFSFGTLEQKLIDCVDLEWQAKEEVRTDKLGYMVQTPQDVHPDERDVVNDVAAELEENGL